MKYNLIPLLFIPFLQASRIHISDGDTIRIEGERIRLACIDAPESDQPWGSQSTQRLSQLIGNGSNLRVQSVDTDRYGRTIAKLYVGDVYVQEQLVRDGLAWVYTRYLDTCPTTNKQLNEPRYARMVPFEEIADPKNDYNLNLPRYIDSTEPEDLQDIDGHLRGGIPERDIDALDAYWQVLPSVRAALFQPEADRPLYFQLRIPIAEVKTAIFAHAEFTAFNAAATQIFDQWKAANRPRLINFDKDGHPKELIETIAEDLLALFKTAPLLDPYDLYQHLMDYWAETMQDDCYMISADGWVAKPERIVETDKKGKTKDKGWACDLVPKGLIVARYFGTQQAAIEAKQGELETVTAGLAELEEEHGSEEDCLGSLEKINKAEVAGRLKELKGDKDAKAEIAILKEWQRLNAEEANYKKAIKEAEAALDKLAYEKYPTLTQAEIKSLVVEDKWLSTLAMVVQTELDRVSQKLTGRVRQLAERYATPLPELVEEVETLSARVEEHLKKMGFDVGLYCTENHRTK